MAVTEEIGTEIGTRNAKDTRQNITLQENNHGKSIAKVG